MAKRSLGKACPSSKNLFVTRSALAAAIVAAFAMAVPGAASAETVSSSHWRPADDLARVLTSKALQYLSGQERSFIVTENGGFEPAGPDSQETNVSGIQVIGSEVSATNFSTGFTLVGLGDYQVVGQALLVMSGQNAAFLTLSGLKANIAYTDNGLNSTVHPDNESSALMITGNPDPTKNGSEQKSSVTRFVSDAAATTIIAKAEGEHAGSINGITVEGLAKAEVTGSTLNIIVSSENDSPIGDDDFTAAGISVVTYRLPNTDPEDDYSTDTTTGFFTGENTKLTVTSSTTGEKESSHIWGTDGAATAIGIFAEGGVIDIGGDAEVKVNAKGGAAVGATLFAQPLDYYDTSELVNKKS